MIINLIDYKGNLGGGLNYNFYLIEYFLKNKIKIRFISCGKILELYKKKFKNNKINFIEIFPENKSTFNRRNFLFIPKTASLLKFLGLGSTDDLIISKDIEKFTGIKLFLWPYGLNFKNIIISNEFFFLIHDVILFDYYKNRSKKYKNFKQIFNSEANFIFTSRATISRAKLIFNLKKIKNNLIRIPNVFDCSFKLKIKKKIIKKPYFIYPANTNHHKNHEDLINSFKEIKDTHSLVLTGDGTDLVNYSYGRQKKLLKIIKEHNLIINKDIYLFGNIPNKKLFELIYFSEALVVTSKMEGGGSFPIIEAINLGKSVISNSVTAIKEYHKVYGGNVIFYNDTSSDLVYKMKTLIKSKQNKINKFTLKRYWDDVIDEYIKIFKKSKQQ